MVTISGGLILSERSEQWSISAGLFMGLNPKYLQGMLSGQASECLSTGQFVGTRSRYLGSILKPQPLRALAKPSDDQAQGHLGFCAMVRENEQPEFGFHHLQFDI